MYFDKLVPF